MKDALCDAILRLRAQGLSFRAIARRMRVHHTNVIVRARRLFDRSQLEWTANTDKFTDTQVDRLIELYGTSMTYQGIADEMGFSRVQIHEKVKKLRRSGRIAGYRIAVPAKKAKHVRRGPSDDGEETPAEIMTDTIRRYVLANPGCNEKEIPAATGYGWAAIRDELRRLQRFDEPIVVRVYGRGWFDPAVADLFRKQGAA